MLNKRFWIPTEKDFPLLTVEDLKEMPSGHVFAFGYGYVEHPWFNNATNVLEKDGRSTRVKWVAVRGGIHDWAIYHSLEFEAGTRYFDGIGHLNTPTDDILRTGGKVTREWEIRSMVPCSDAAFELYRY